MNLEITKLTVRFGTRAVVTMASWPWATPRSWGWRARAVLASR